jgi:hypothetical protein
MKEVRTFMVLTLAFGAKRVVRFEVPATFILPGVMKEVRTFMVPKLAFGAKRVVRFEVPATFILPGVVKEVRTFMVPKLAFGAKRVVRFEVPFKLEIPCTIKLVSVPILVIFPCALATCVEFIAPNKRLEALMLLKTFPPPIK